MCMHVHMCMYEFTCQWAKHYGPILGGGQNIGLLLGGGDQSLSMYLDALYRLVLYPIINKRSIGSP